MPKHPLEGLHASFCGETVEGQRWKTFCSFLLLLLPLVMGALPFLIPLDGDPRECQVRYMRGSLFCAFEVRPMIRSMIRPPKAGLTCGQTRHRPTARYQPKTLRPTERQHPVQRSTTTGT